MGRERVVYTTLCALAGSNHVGEIAPLTEMARLWAAHLRGPARFDGRIILLTNVDGLRIDGCEIVPTLFRSTDRKQLFLERVRHYRHVPVGPNDQVMQLDLDALAVAPLHRLFTYIRPGEMVAARSGLSPLDHEHAGQFMSRMRRWSYRSRGWYHRAGVSACITMCTGSDWPRLMRRWAAAVRVIGRNRPVPQLGDQTFLNFLYLTGAAPIRRLPTSLVFHVKRADIQPSDPAAERAVVVHFPLPDKLRIMQRWSRL